MKPWSMEGALHLGKLVRNVPKWKVELNIYAPSTDPSNPGQCSCIFQGTNTPNGQMKGVNGGTCEATPAPGGEPNPG